MLCSSSNHNYPILFLFSLIETFLFGSHPYYENYHRISSDYVNLVRTLFKSSSKSSYLIIIHPNDDDDDELTGMNYMINCDVFKTIVSKLNGMGIYIKVIGIVHMSYSMALYRF